MCEHKNIIITIKDKYELKRGWVEDIEENDNADMGQFFIESEQESVFCEDCGEYIDN